MIIARIFPKKSQNFKNAKPFFQKIGDSMDSGGWIRLFSLWTLIVAGIVLNMDFENRYVYWSWSGWESGFVKLVVASVVYLYFLNPNLQTPHLDYSKTMLFLTPKTFFGSCACFIPRTISMLLSEIVSCIKSFLSFPTP